MNPAVTAMLPAGLKIDRQAHIRRASSWILCASVFVAASLTPCMVGAQAVDTSAAPQRLEAQPMMGAQAVDTSAAPQSVDASAAPPRLEERPARRRTARWHITPQVTVSETYTDNEAHAPSGSAQSGWVRDLTPGIRVEGAGPRVTGFFDYRLHDLAYANQSQLNNRQNLLNSFATVEAVENWLFVDARASITQQNTSAFGAAVQDTASASTNRTETTVYQVSPYLRGKVSDIAAYQIRFNQTGSRTNAGASAATEMETTEWVARIKNTPSSSKVGWSFDSDAMTIRNDTVGKKQNGRIRGSLIYDIYPELHASLIYGRENTDYASSTMQSANTPGFGLEWSPGARTQFVAVKERRSFGEGHSLLLSHRTPLVALIYTDNKDVTVMSNQIAAAGQGSAYALMSDLLASSIPDPEARGQAVRSRLEQTGVSTAPAGGFITSSIFVNHNREASAVLLGRRNTMTITLNQRVSQSIGPGAASVTDSFSSSTDIRQQAATVAWMHRLSPLSTITNSVSQLHTSGSGVTSIESRQNSHNAFFTYQIGVKASVSVGVRRTQFFSTVAPGYRENAFVGSLLISF